MLIRLMEPQEKAAVIALAKSNFRVKDFPYVWTRWKHWESWPPIVAVENDEIYGFLAFTFLKHSKYVNNYYIATAEKARGLGIAGQMTSFLLVLAKKAGMERFKTKAAFDSSGQKFYEGIGLRPFAKDEKQFLYDADLGGVESFKDWIMWNRQRYMHASIPEKQLKRYMRQRIVILDDGQAA